jgi:hypothetical protein
MRASVFNGASGSVAFSSITNNRIIPTASYIYRFTNQQSNNWVTVILRVLYDCFFDFSAQFVLFGFVIACSSFCLSFYFCLFVCLFVCVFVCWLVDLCLCVILCFHIKFDETISSLQVGYITPSGVTFDQYTLVAWTGGFLSAPRQFRVGMLMDRYDQDLPVDAVYLALAAARFCFFTLAF